MAKKLSQYTGYARSWPKWVLRHYDKTATNSNLCWATSNDLTCTRRSGHKGLHVAHGIGDNSLYSWSDDGSS